MEPVDPMAVRVIYVGGPRDGETDEEVAGAEEGDPPGVWRLYGFEEWSMDGRPPAGRYDPDTSQDQIPVPYIWHAYSPEEQAEKLRNPYPFVKVMPAGSLEARLFRARLLWARLRSFGRGRRPGPGAGM